VLIPSDRSHANTQYRFSLTLLLVHGISAALMPRASLVKFALAAGLGTAGLQAANTLIGTITRAPESRVSDSLCVGRRTRKLQPFEG